MTQSGRYEEAREVAGTVEDNLSQSKVLTALATALAQAGCYAEAREIADTIEDNLSRSKALNSVAAALAKAGDNHRADEMFEEALEVVGTSSVAIALVQAERFSYAFAVSGLRGLDAFLDDLTKWVPSFEKVAPGLAIGMLREATGIAGWVRSDWRKIHELSDF